jgi:hypothetical protein
VVNGIAELRLKAVQRAERVIVENPTRSTVVIGAVVAVTRDPDDRLLLDGTLQGSLPPPHWAYSGHLGPFVVFENTEARGPAWLERPGSTSPSAPTDPSGSVTTAATMSTGAETMYVNSPQPVQLVRSVTYASGWTARVTPSAGARSRTATVRRIGLVQSVELPAGTYTVTWRYAPKSLRAGLIASASGSLVFLTLAALWLRRTTGRRRYVGAAAHTL